MNPTDMTREQLITELTAFRELFAKMELTMANIKFERQNIINDTEMENFQLLTERFPEHHNRVLIIPGEKYTCECGAEISVKARKRHEASARHIRMVAQIRD
jgi:hypothetical protein